MSDNRARYLAHRDQQMALANELLTNMVADVRTMLDQGRTPDDVALAVAAAADDVDPDRIGTALGVALVRLAQQSGGPR